MMNRSALLALAAGALGAALLVAAAQGSVLGMAFGVLLSPLPLAMAVLSFGSAVLPFAAAGGAVAASLLSGTFAFAVVYMVLDVAPVAVLVRIARQEPADGAAVGKWIGWLAIGAMVLMVLGLAAIPVGADGIEATVKSRLEDMLKAATAAGSLTAPNAADVIAALASFLPSAAAWDWCMRAMVSAAVAQAILMRLGEATTPTPPYRGVAVPPWYIAVFWATAATAWLAQGDVKYVAMNAASVLCLPLLMQGLAVVHSAMDRVEHRRALLVAFYVTVFVMAALAIIVLVTLGVVEHFLKLRARMTPPAQGG